MLKISSLKKLVTDSIAIDLGTASTIIAVKGRGVVLDEPSLIAINEITNEIVALGLAAAFGAGVLPTDKRASAIVDIGAGTTNIAIIAKGSVVHSTSERYGGNAINESLATHLRRHRGLQVGEETTELLKTTFASTFLPDELDRSIEIRGRDVQTGSPGAAEITAGEIYPIVESIVRRIALLVKDTLTE